MSYSFSIRAANKTEAKHKLAAEFDKVIGAQPAHLADRAQAQAAAGAFVDLVKEDESLDIVAAVSGSISYGVGGTHAASVQVNAYLTSKETPAA
jgi:hypothetical protein